MEARNASAPARLGFKIVNVSDGRAYIAIEDVIGDSWEGTTASAFIREMRDLGDVALDLHINSPGGYVNDALAIYNALKNHTRDVIAYIDGMAASAASFVAMAATQVLIAKNAKMFIHDGHAMGIGNAADFRNMADELDRESQNIASIYAEKAGGSADSWRAAMRANDGVGTLYIGMEAVDAGLADALQTPPARNIERMRIAAQVNEEALEPENEEPENDEDIVALIPPLANGYKAPLPADFTRLIAANLPVERKA